MNIYVVVEGEVGEKQVYREWIPYVNSALKFSSTLDQVNNNNFFIMHGGGYPQYFTVIQNAINDVLSISLDGINRLFDRLVVSTDAEENSYEEKFQEIKEFIESNLENKKIKYLDCKIIIQNFCLETWGLGNRKIISQSNKSDELKKLTKKFNVSKKDPELLTLDHKETLTRAQYAEKYLRAALLSKHKNLTYNKSNPQALLNKKYFDQLKSRLHDTKHILSFQGFLDAFK